MKIRAKMPELEAVQFHLREYADNPLVFDEVPSWLDEAISGGVIKPEFRTEDYWYLEIKSNNGYFLVGPGDWIIRGTNGAIYPVESDAFNKFYEEVA